MTGNIVTDKKYGGLSENLFAMYQNSKKCLSSNRNVMILDRCHYQDK